MSDLVPTDTWIKTVSGRWSIALNWSDGVPISGENLVIAPVSPELIAFNIANFGIGALTLEGATLQLNAGSLTANGGATLDSATIEGSQSLIVSGASTVTRVTVGGSAELRNRGVVTQSGGTLAIGDTSTSQAEVVNLAGATWIDADNSAMTATGGYGFANFGDFEDSDGSGATAISAYFKSTGTVTVAVGGALVFAASGAQTRLSGTIDGGGTVEYGENALAMLGALTVIGTNQNNLGVANLTGTQVLSGAQTIENLGQWNFYGDVSLQASAAQSADIQFNSSASAVVAKTGGVGVSAIDASANIAGGVNVETGTLDFAGSTSAFSGDIYGAGTFEIAAGNAQFEPADLTTESISVARFLLSGGTSDIIGRVTDSGAFEGDSGATLTISGALTLTGAADLAGLDVLSGGADVIGELVVGSTASVSGANIGGAAQLLDTGFVTQSGGNLTLSGEVPSPTDAAPLTIDSGGVWDIADASGIALGTAFSSIDIGYSGSLGLLDKTGAGVSTIAPVVFNNSFDVAANGGVTYEGVEAEAGTLDLQNVVTGAGSDNIVGGATLEFDNAVAAGQTVSFFGAGGALELTDAPAFAGAITGFDTAGSSDALLILANGYHYSGATETATAATLAFSNGASAFSLTLTGDYQGGSFAAQTLASGQIKITL
jgi:fibronectin-binding autotransporter adhesin